jgi:hypothetical protein
VAATELAFTLEAVQTGADPSFSVNVQAGSNRVFIVAIGLPYSYTVINGVTLNGTSLTAVTDGTTTAQGNDTDFGHGVKFWILKEASFPATGSRTLAIDTVGAGTEGYWIAHWQMAGVDQTSTIIDVAVTSHTSTDPLSTTGLAATAADQECFAICCSTNPATGTTLTIDGTGITQVTVDNDPPSAFPHYWKAGHKTVQSGSRTVTVDATGSQSSNLIVAFILGTTGTTITATSPAFSSDVATASASATVARTATAAFASGAAAAAATATVARTATAAFASDVATMAATGTVARTATAAFVSGAATWQSDGGVADEIGTGAFGADAAQMAATGTVARTGTSAFASGAASAAADAVVSRVATAAFSAAAASMAVSAFVGATHTGTSSFAAQGASVSATGEVSHGDPGTVTARVTARPALVATSRARARARVLSQPATVEVTRV